MLRGGNEAHNPENGARPALLALVGPEEFARYLDEKYVWVQGPSGLYYALGHVPHIEYRHGLRAAWRKEGPRVADMCFSFRAQQLPLSVALLGMVAFLQDHEGEIWQRAGIVFARQEPGAHEVYVKTGFLNHYWKLYHDAQGWAVDRQQYLKKLERLAAAPAPLEAKPKAAVKGQAKARRRPRPSRAPTGAA